MLFCGEIGDKFLQKLLTTSDQELTLCSGGGCVYCYAAAVDQLKVCPTHIHVTGMCMSAAVPIVAHGQKGHRTASPGTRFMVHECSTRIPSSYTGEIVAEAEEMKRIEQKYWRDLAECTNLSAEEWAALCVGKPYYFDAEEALTKGVVDAIVIQR
jgi:ATP-dependent protease ClpP protease subunit